MRTLLYCVLLVLLSVWLTSRSVLADAVSGSLVCEQTTGTFLASHTLQPYEPAVLTPSLCYCNATSLPRQQFVMISDEVIGIASRAFADRMVVFNAQGTGYFVDVTYPDRLAVTGTFTYPPVLVDATYAADRRFVYYFTRHPTTQSITLHAHNQLSGEVKTSWAMISDGSFLFLYENGQLLSVERDSAGGLSMYTWDPVSIQRSSSGVAVVSPPGKSGPSQSVAVYKPYAYDASAKTLYLAVFDGVNVIVKKVALDPQLTVSAGEEIRLGQSVPLAMLLQSGSLSMVVYHAPVYESVRYRQNCGPAQTQCPWVLQAAVALDPPSANAKADSACFLRSNGSFAVSWLTTNTNTNCDKNCTSTSYLVTFQCPILVSRSVSFD